MLRDPSAVAPGELERVRQFLNTSNRYHDRDELASVAEATPVLRRLGLLPDQQTLTVRDLALLRQTRTSLRASKCPDEAGDDHEGMTGIPLRLRVDGERLALVGAADGLWGEVGTLLAAVYAASLLGHWERLKACANPDCRWFFYDTSRPRTGKWCSMTICGNQHKSRAYRSRRAPR